MTSFEPTLMDPENKYYEKERKNEKRQKGGGRSLEWFLDWRNGGHRIGGRTDYRKNISFPVERVYDRANNCPFVRIRDIVPERRRRRTKDVALEITGCLHNSWLQYASDLLLLNFESAGKVRTRSNLTAHDLLVRRNFRRVVFLHDKVYVLYGNERNVGKL